MTLRRWLMTIADQPEPEPREVEALALGALAALRAGYRPTLEDLEDAAERAAWGAAAQSLAVERALRLAAAIDDPARALAEVDGGAAYYQAAAEVSAAQQAAEIRARRGGA